jgi:hypothetical protein
MTTRAELAVVFAALRTLMRRHAGSFTVEADRKDRYMLAGGWSAKRKRHITAGGVVIGKNYVSYHLMPIYVCPDLLKGLSPALRKRMQGKSCFNFTRVDPVLMKELDRLTRVGYERFRKMRFD